MNKAEFCNIPEVKYWQSQLHESNTIRNIEKISGTKKAYLYPLLDFDNYLRRNYTTTIIELLKIDPKIITKYAKTYLTTLTQSPSTIDRCRYAILSFYREHEVELNIRFTNKKTRLNITEDNIMTLQDLLKMLSVPKIQLLEKAVFMCKFQRGLDSITFADRFNYDCFEQLCNYFGSTDHTIWDVRKCPVPIKIVRVKTNYLHTGFLDRDAITCLQDYLITRPVIDGILFRDSFGNPITRNWIGRRFMKLRKNAGLKNQFTSHELRDLLKSTLITCNTRYDVADHCIGHTPKDTYEKQHILYPDTMRAEYTKASKMINILSQKIKEPVLQPKMEKPILQELYDIRNTVNSLIGRLEA